MQISDQLYFQRCFELAELGNKRTRPNPKVGAVIVCNDRIIGEGYHQKYGGAHAEVNAIKDIDEKDRLLLKDSTIYVSLEPCHHFGKTPPCVDLIIKNNIPIVKIACPDPTDKVYYKSIRKLKENNIDVTVLENHLSALDTIHEFLSIQRMNRPYIQIKLAKSAFNYMGTKEGQVYLSNEYTNVYTHKLRAYTDAILIGTNTAKVDDPSITLRNYPGQQPIRIVLDRLGTLPHHLQLLKDDHKTIIVTEVDDYPLGENKFSIKLDFSSNNFLEDLFAELLNLKIYHLMVEGGSQLIRSFIKGNYWDEGVIINTKHPLQSGVKAPQLMGRLMSSMRLLDNEIHIIKNDILG